MKNQLLPYKIIDTGDMSQSTLTSKVTDIRYLDNIAIFFTFTGTPTGTFHVFGNMTNDTTNGVEITLPSSPVASGAAGTILIDMNQQAYPYIYVTYTKSSGTGSVNVFITGKSI